ncbi:MAG: nitroreductase family protein [Chloroflexota bacterium]
MVNQTLELINEHASVSNYESDPVSVDLLETIISAAQRASTSSNIQSYSVVVTTLPKTLEKLSIIASNQEHVRTPPVFLTWCADLARIQKVCQMHNHDQNTSFFDNFLVAAVDASISA